MGKLFLQRKERPLSKDSLPLFDIFGHKYLSRKCYHCLTNKHHQFHFQLRYINTGKSKFALILITKSLFLSQHQNSLPVRPNDQLFHEKISGICMELVSGTIFKGKLSDIVKRTFCNQNLYRSNEMIWFMSKQVPSPVWSRSAVL